MSVDFRSQIKLIEQEIKSLKISANLTSRVRGYSAQKAVTDSNRMITITITYEAGQNDIVSEFYYPGVIYPGSVNGDTQTVYLYSPYTTTFTVLSTRPINSITVS